MAPAADLPPPPYTETDIYSTSSGDNPRSPNPNPNPNPNPHHHHRRESSASTIDHDPIYTPPETPRSSPADLLSPPPPPPPATFVSAASYFDSRPPPPGLVAILSVGGLPHLTHTFVSVEDGMPYPADPLAERSVTEEDWLTFGNYLRPTQPADAGDEKKEKGKQPEAEPPSAAHVEATLAEWNAGFFGPRGVVVQWRAERQQQEEHRVPGAWDAAFDGPAAAGAGPSAAGPRFGGGFNPFGGGGSGIRFGGIRIDGDRVSIGDRFVADRNGLRMGGVVADGNGISVNGQPMFGGPPVGGARWPGGHCGRGGWGGFSGQRGGGHWGGRGGWGGPPGGGPCGGGGGGGFGFGFGGRGRGGWPGRGGGGGGDGEEGGRGRGRWRGRGRHGPGGRERSDSVSSASSSSSSSSESSVGSLPEYEDLGDAQLPVAKQHLEEWLHHPDQPITKERIKEVKAQIKAAKKAPSPAGPAGYDPKALKKEVKALFKEWKALKKEQSRAHKELRRERRQKRKDERRERRNVRRDMRRAERDFRRGHHTGGPPMMQPGGAPGGFPFAPPMPHMGGVPPVPPPGGAPGAFPFAPPFPHMGGAPPVPPPAGPFGHMFGRWAGAGLAGVPSPMHRSGPVPPIGPDVMGRTPGAWPDQFYGIDGDDAHRASLAKYKVVRDLEAQIAGKESELIGVHEAITLEDEEKRHAGGKDSRDGKGQTRLETDALTLENEIEALSRNMNQLRTEADEEFVKEMVADEERKQGGVRW